MSEEQKQLDTEALVMATKAFTKAEELEKFTIRGFEDMKRDMIAQTDSFMGAIKRVQQRLDSVFILQMSVGGAIIALLLGVIGYLLTNGTPWS